MQDKTPINSITIKAPARLHLGFLDLNGDLARRFGSIGMAINEPSTIIQLTPAKSDTATGPEAKRALDALKRFKQSLSVVNCYEVTVNETIPAHAGLGSGTQLALAVGVGLATLEQQPHPVAKLGEILSRGARSAIGIGAFRDGGFIIDGGKGTQSSPPPILSQTNFPEDWRVLLVFDPKAMGVHGEREYIAFSKLPPMSSQEVGTICRLTLMQLLPGLLDQNINAFGDAITQIQRIVGAYFATAQGGGIWASQHVATIVKRLGEMGAKGIGQSSWGPTGFAFVETQAAAENLYHSLVQDAKAMGLDIIIARGRNSGATIKRSATSERSDLKISDLNIKQY